MRPRQPSDRDRSMDRRPELRPRTRTLWEQLTAPDPAIRDLLKIPHDAEGGRDGGGDAERRACTLMDAIDQESRGRGMISWKPRLRDRLRLRRDANALSTTTSNRRAVEDGAEEEEESKDEAPAAASTSLMALLEQTDDPWDDDDEEDEDRGSAPRSSEAAADDDEENGECREEEEEMARACCVCMVRHKGAAFIPCGHTFCRPCSRDLWHTGACCPLCNVVIHDVLHIF